MNRIMHLLRADRDGRRHRRHIKHPYIALVGATAGAFTTVEGVSWLLASPPSPQSAVLFALRTAALVWFALDPRFGAYALMLSQCIDFVVPQTTPISMMFVALLVVGVSAYLNLWRGVALACLLVCGSALNMVLFPASFMAGGGLISYAVLALVSIFVGVLTRSSLHRREQRILGTSATANNAIARHLHDYTTNDMNDIIMLSNAIIDAPSSTPDQDESIHRIQQIAMNALAQTRNAIGSLEGTGTPTSPDPGSTRGRRTHSNLQEQVSDLLDEQQELLESLGFKGAVIMPSPLPDSHDADGPVLLGLLRELFGNIAHHASPRRGYTLAICCDQRYCDISLADTPIETTNATTGERAETDALLEGMSSGLRRYENVVITRHGEWEITATPDNWSLHATLVWS